MPIENLNERVAVLEYRAESHEKVISDFLEFKEDMITQIAELKSSISLLTWKVGLIVGLTVSIGVEVLQWVFKHILP